MKVLSSWRFKVALILIIGFLSIPKISALEMSEDPFQELERAFPNSIHINASDKKSIEFCPDNTCDLFVADKEIPLETLKDFAYLYIYFFSDYYILGEWRNRKESMAIAKEILSKPSYKDCKKDEEDAACCILRKLAQNSLIRLYFVRYDEGKRNLVPEDLFEKTSKSHLKRKQK
jgi:hypothetical protein